MAEGSDVFEKQNALLCVEVKGKQAGYSVASKESRGKDHPQNKVYYSFERAPVLAIGHSQPMNLVFCGHIAY